VIALLAGLLLYMQAAFVMTIQASAFFGVDQSCRNRRRRFAEHWLQMIAPETLCPDSASFESKLR
jgi:hypothetical protein